VHRKFMIWFEKEYPEFINQFGEIQKFYDASSDEFHIEEINDAYVDFKNDKEPLPMYFGNSGWLR